MHYCKESPLGPFWSVTKHKDIIALEVNHRSFSSLEASPYATGRATLSCRCLSHGPAAARSAAQGGAADRLAGQSGQFRGADQKRVRAVLDGLPRGKTFDWVDKVSIELTAQMLATLFDFPFDERRKLSTGRMSRPRCHTKAGWSKARSSARRFSANASPISWGYGTNGLTPGTPISSGCCPRRGPAT